MATDRKSLGTPIIPALHARYEQAWAAYNRLDEAQPSPRPTDFPALSLYHACEAAMSESTDETDCIRRLICLQLPESDEDLTIIAFHVFTLIDLDEKNKADDRALKAGITGILDYLVADRMGSKAASLGQQFFSVATLVRRYILARCGELGG